MGSGSDSEPKLLQALHFPTLSRYGAAATRVGPLERVLCESLSLLLRELPATQLFRCLPPAEWEVRRHRLKVPPARKSPLWSRPVECHFWALHYALPRPPEGVSQRQPQPAWVAYFPALDCTVLGVSPEDLEAQIEQQLLTTLQRLGLTRSLQQLLPTQQDGSLEVWAGETRLRREQHEEEKKSVLQEAASPLLPRKQPRAFERETEVALLARNLASRSPRSVLLVAESGQGKSAVFYELIRQRDRFQLGSTPFFETTGSRLMSGQVAFGAWQKRCQELCQEAEKERAVLHLGNLFELSQVGRLESDPLGMAEFFRPWIERGRLLSVAECTPAQLERIEKEHPQLLQAFAIQTLKPLIQESCLRILRRLAPETERDGLEEILVLHRRWTSAQNWPAAPIRFLQQLLSEDAPLTRTRVAQSFARGSGLPLLFLDGDQRLDLEELERWFSTRVRSQPAAVQRVVERLAAVKAGLNRPGQPIASLLLVGPTGVGKTELARSLAEYLFSDRQSLTRFDMSEYSSPWAVAQLTGLAGNPQPGILVQKCRERPFQVILFDEVEKAHPDFFDLLLQILGDGRLTDQHGNVADFCSCLILMTSNLGAEQVHKGSLGLRAQNPDNRLLEQVRQSLRPELLNRIDDLLPFSALPLETVQELTREQLQAIGQRLGRERRLESWTVSPEVIEFLARSGYEPRYGARPLLRSIDRWVLAPLAQGLLRHPAEAPLRIYLSVRGPGLTVEVLTSEQPRPHLNREAGGEISAWRRLLQKLRQGPLLRQIFNDKTRHQQSKSQEPFPLEGLLLKHRQLLARAQQLEEERLLEMCQLSSRSGSGEGAEALGKELRQLVLRLFEHSFESPHQVTLAIFSEYPRRVLELAQKYQGLCQHLGGKSQWMEVSVRRSGASKDPLDPRPHLQRSLLEELPERFGELGLVGCFQARGMYAWLQREAGVHTFVHGDSLQSCWVEVDQSPLQSGDEDEPWKSPAYSPPETIHRRGFVSSRERMRTYDLDTSRILDVRWNEAPSSPMELQDWLEEWLYHRALEEALPS